MRKKRNLHKVIYTPENTYTAGSYSALGVLVSNFKFTTFTAFLEM
jgi:hypothetical protein